MARKWDLRLSGEGIAHLISQEGSQPAIRVVGRCELGAIIRWTDTGFMDERDGVEFPSSHRP